MREIVESLFEHALDRAGKAAIRQERYEVLLMVVGLALGFVIARAFFRYRARAASLKPSDGD